jgi:hypothetical protein
MNFCSKNRPWESMVLREKKNKESMFIFLCCQMLLSYNPFLHRKKIYFFLHVVTTIFINFSSFFEDVEFGDEFRPMAETADNLVRPPPNPPAAVVSRFRCHKTFFFLISQKHERSGNNLGTGPISWSVTPHSAGMACQGQTL